MMRQYSPQRFRYAVIRAGNIRREVQVGTIDVGTIFRCTPTETHRQRERPMIVEAWLPREIGAGRKVGKHYASCYVARGGHLAQVRCLETGERKLLADNFIRFCIKHGSQPRTTTRRPNYATHNAA